MIKLIKKKNYKDNQNQENMKLNFKTINDTYNKLSSDINKLNEEKNFLYEILRKKEEENKIIINSKDEEINNLKNEINNLYKYKEQTEKNNNEITSLKK